MKRYKFMAVLLLLGLLTGCGKAEAPPQETTTQPAETTAVTEPEQLPKPEYTGIPVETPYITLYCPEEWEGSVEQQVTQEDGNYVLSFQLISVEKPVTLFSLTVGPEEATGYYLGCLETEQGVIYVYSTVNEQTPADWSEEDYAEICHQQERVNDLILQLHEDQRFQSA